MHLACDFAASFKVTTETVVLHDLPESRSPVPVLGSILVEPGIRRFGQQALEHRIQNLRGNRIGQPDKGSAQR